MPNSLADSVEIGVWTDGDASEAAFPTLEDALKNVENFDDSLSFLEESEGTSHLEPILSPPFANLAYPRDPGVSIVRLDSQSHQLAALANKSGNPMCVCSSKELLAVGGSKGMIMLFNAEGRLECFFSGEVEAGSVSCVAFSEDGRFLAAGYGRGVVKIFRVKRRTLLHTIKDAVQPGTGILQVAFLDSNNDFLTLDTAGNVFEVRLKTGITRKIYHSVRCVFSGCNGEVLHVRALPQRLIVLLTVTKILVVTTQRGGSVLCAFPSGSLDSYPPVFDYNLLTEKRRKYFRICMGRNDKLSIFALYPDKFGTKQKVAALLKVIQLPLKVVSVNWMGPAGLVAFDDTGRSLYINPEKGSYIRGWDQELPILFSTSTYKAIETGGNVSAAMSSLAEYACYQSISRFGDSLDILTHDGIYKVRANNELDQLARYQERGDKVSPCLFILDLLKDRIKPMVCTRERLLTLIEVALQNLTLFIADSKVDGEAPDLSSSVQKQMQTLLHVSVESGQYPVLYDFAWPRFEVITSLRAAFLESLDEFVLDGQLSNAPPTIISAYLTELANEGHFSQLQAAVCRFPIASIDLHMVMTVCRQNNLYDGVIHVMNKALLDYIGPLEEMLDTVAGFASHDVVSDAEMEQGNRLLLYIQCCLAGHGYPLGELPPELQSSVPLEVYRCITSIRGKDGSSSAAKYPNLRILLLFDAQQFFHVISTCVDAHLFTSCEGRLQRLMDMLGDICDAIGSVEVLLQYLVVIIRLVDDSRIIAPVDLLERCISTLLRHPIIPEAAENVILDALDSVPQLNRAIILRMSLYPFRFRICLHIYFAQRKFVEILRAIMASKTNTKQMIFPALRKILVADLSQEEMTQLSVFLKSIIGEISQIDSMQTAQLIIDNFPHFLADLNTKEEKERRSVFPLVKAAFDIRKERHELFLTGDEELDEHLFGLFFEGLIEVCKWKDADLKQLLAYWLPIGSRSDFCLNMAMPNGLFLTSVQLLNARGLISRSFELIFEKITNCTEETDLVIWIDELLNLVSRYSVEADENSWLIRSFREIVKRSRSTKDGETDSRLLLLIRRIMSGGSQHAYELFSCLLDSQSFKSGDLASNGAILTQMLSSCKYEKRLLISILKTMEQENATLMENYQHVRARRTTSLTVPQCYVCHSAMAKAFYSYACGHIVHFDCRTADETTRICSCSTQSRSNIARSNLLRHPPNNQKRNIFAKWKEELRLVP